MEAADNHPIRFDGDVLGPSTKRAQLDVLRSIPLPQSTAIDRTGRVLREVFEEDDLVGNLVGGQALRDKGDQFAYGDRHMKPATDESDNTFAPDRIRGTDDAGFSHARMLIEDCLNFLW